MNEEGCSSERLRRIGAILEGMYGKKEWGGRRNLLDVLVETILSQNTSDVNSDRAARNLKARFRNWDDVARADVSEIADAVRIGGLADQKAVWIKDLLERIREEKGAASLEFLETWDKDDARTYLESFKGVGPKTSACVLLFGCGTPVFPVDTHIMRIGKRLGCLGPKDDAARAHEIFGAAVPADLAYSLHVNMIAHGRKRCRPARPVCSGCRLQGECRYFWRGEMRGQNGELRGGSTVSR